MANIDQLCIDMENTEINISFEKELVETYNLCDMLDIGNKTIYINYKNKMYGLRCYSNWTVSHLIYKFQMQMLHF